MAKERMLTVLVPITDADAVVVNELPPVDSENINVIYKYEGVYKRVQKNEQGIYVYVDVVDREFPYIGKPLEIFDFTYDAERMGPAPTISAQGVMWYADKDSHNRDVTLEDLWSQECHVSFNGENFYLKQIPTSSKSNNDARYKYDLDFVSERVVLENVYLYDVVQPFITERPLSESSQFSFYGDINELIYRINASLLRSGLSRIEFRYNFDWRRLSKKPSDWNTNWQKYFDLRNGEYIPLDEIFTTQSPAFLPNVYYEFGHPRLLSDGVTLAEQDQFFTYAEWCSIKMGTYDGPLSTADVYIDVTEVFEPNEKAHATIFDHYSGDYNAYLRNEVYQLDEYGELVIAGYICRIGKDKKGFLTSSEEKLITFENNTIYEALQHVKDTFDLQYYTVREKGSDGKFTGNTLIMVADCEHDFADLNQSGTDFVRDSVGLPMSSNPLEYGVNNELLSKEKTNTTDKIITRITGIGSSENIPWHYPNPTGDGWVKPVYKRNGEEFSIEIDYPNTEGNNTEEYVRYEKYLKNRIGDVIHYGLKYLSLHNINFIAHESSLSELSAVITYDFEVKENSSIEVSAINTWDNENTIISCVIKKFVDNEYVIVTNPILNLAFLNGGVCQIDEGLYRVTYNFTFSNRPTVIDDVNYYWYPEKETDVGFLDSWPLSFFSSQWASFLGALPLWMTLIPVPGAVELAIVKYFSSGFTVRRGSFISTNPNLKYKSGSGNVKQEGWYDENNNLVYPDRPEENNVVYAFKGGEGHKTLGTDDVIRIGYGDKKYLKVTPINETGYSSNSVADVINYLINYVLGSTSSIATEITSFVENVEPTIDDFVTKYFDFSINIYENTWSKDSKSIVLSDYGLSFVENPLFLINDTIEFQRVKYVTPQPNLMPEVYIKTDGERRFYNAHNYYPLQSGTADPTIGEVQLGANVTNPLYKENENGANDTHYVFENEYIKIQPKEHIQSFEDIKPSIKGQTNTIVVNGQEHTFRIDVVEEFAYDMYDNDEVWESNDNGNVSGEYKHPYIFAKLRPLGFNLFDMALQEDMVLSMTTGHCGSCNFRIGVDENTKKNPVQIWEYDVYSGDTYATKGERIYAAGDLKRVVDTSHLFYDTDGTQEGYISVNLNINVIRSGFLVNESLLHEAHSARFERAVYPSSMILNGEVGSLKQTPRNNFEGDVIVNGRFIPSQQDTSENYVWVALLKDTDTYGTIMPSAQPDYGDDNYSRYIEPKGAHYYDRKLKQWFNLTDDEADKFVLVNIRFPQIYLRRAEHKLSKELVKYMYEHNYQMFNFSIGFSRIFLAQNENIEQNINENSVLYVSFNNRTYRQYVKHYTYHMSKDDVLPEIKVDMNEELSVSRTKRQADLMANRQIINDSRAHTNEVIKMATERLSRLMVGRNDDVIVNGSIISKDAKVSIFDISQSVNTSKKNISDNSITINNNFRKTAEFVGAVNTFNTSVESHLKQIRKTIETRVLPTLTGVEENDSCVGANKYYFTPTLQADNQVALFWLSPSGSEQITTEGLCPSNQGMTDLSWENYDISY